MPEQRKRRLAAVWFADIVGYTDLSARDEEAALAVVDELQTLAREEVESRGGRIVKFVGDAVLTVFDSADAALRSALALRDAFTDSEVVQRHECVGIDLHKLTTCVCCGCHLLMVARRMVRRVGRKPRFPGPFPRRPRSLESVELRWSWPMPK